MRCITALLFVSLFIPATADGQVDRRKIIGSSRGDKMIAEYFRRETAKIERSSLSKIKTLADWNKERDIRRGQMFEMLGLKPRPRKTPLKATVTGKVDHKDFTVENLHFQSLPGLYVTGNLYVPKKRAGKLPAILYVCGHGRVKFDGVSYGNKAHYQHHGAWFARNGYVCLTIDTLQLGEIEGIHHGTYRHGRWWWNARGYTPAGVEAWNCIRALDYLETRKEVDVGRIGVTGRSGGGAYSWWIAALDERIKAAVPVAGITSLANHVVDGCVEGHCDCMYMLNTYRWDFPLVAALVAPRPLLISNSDKDRIFPLDGVVDVYTKVRRIYELYRPQESGVMRKLGLQITEGPHSDTQELRIHAFHWFNKYLKGTDPLIEMTAVKLFKPEQLKVFDALPGDEINTKIDETFVAAATPPAAPQSTDDWARIRDGKMKSLREHCFRGWPAIPRGAGLELKPVFRETKHGVEFAAYDFTSQPGVRLTLYLAHRAGLKRSELELVVLNAVDDAGWRDLVSMMSAGFADRFAAETAKPDRKAFDQQAKMLGSFKWGMAWVAPRGIGPTRWNSNERKRVQIRRRFMLLGQTLDGMRTWDVRRAAQSLRRVEDMQNVPLWMQGSRVTAGTVLYASLFERDVKRLDLHGLPASHRDGPIYLNVLRFLDLPAAVALAAERSRVRLYNTDAAAWSFPREVAKRLKWDPKQFQIRDLRKQDSKPTGK